MEKVLIQGLDGQGPGDILGAITHQAEIDGEMVGDIDIRDSYAIVEIDANLIDLVISKMDDNYVGRSRVSVKRFDDHDPEAMDAIASYVDRYEQLVEYERKEEMRQHEQEIERLSGYQREDRGRALMEMRGQEEGETLAGVAVKFLKQAKGTPLPETEISVGDLVMVSKREPLRDDNPTGTVTQVTNYSITVVFETDPPSFVTADGIRLDLYVNDVTYQRMKDALETCQHASGRLVRLRDIISGQEEPTPVEEGQDLSILDSKLNTSQRQAVTHSMAADDFYLIHGPPGTGKTTTVIEVIRQAVEQDDAVLATAASNTAVDNIVRFLVEAGVDVVRVGHPARVTERLHERTLAARIESNERYQKAETLRSEAMELKDKQESLTPPSGRYRRGMSNERIKDLAEEGTGARGVAPERIQEMAEFLDLEDEIDALFEKAERCEQEAIEQELLDADVVCTTNASAGREMFDPMVFDLLVIDEATQATEPSCLIPITMAERVVLAGDHRQLPPTVKSQQAAEQGLEQSLFEKLANRCGETIMSQLDRQYRMHTDIMRFPNEQFYDGSLKAADAVAEHTLSAIGVDLDDVDGWRRSIIDPDEPLVFLDTAALDAHEHSRHGSTSRENEKEAEIVTRLIEGFRDAGVSDQAMAVIAPYQDQVDQLRSRCDGIEIDTVDGFQGRESEVVIISLTRSNEQGDIGFLDDIRRLNVALTRARRKLVVIGDSTTVRSDDLYAQFIDAVKTHGLYYSLDSEGGE